MPKELYSEITKTLLRPYKLTVRIFRQPYMLGHHPKLSKEEMDWMAELLDTILTYINRKYTHKKAYNMTLKLIDRLDFLRSTNQNIDNYEIIARDLGLENVEHELKKLCIRLYSRGCIGFCLETK